MQIFANGKRSFHSVMEFYVTIKRSRGKNLIIVPLISKSEKSLSKNKIDLKVALCLTVVINNKTRPGFRVTLNF